jgi:hypothetical protein
MLGRQAQLHGNDTRRPRLDGTARASRRPGQPPASGPRAWTRARSHPRARHRPAPTLLSSLRAPTFLPYWRAAQPCPFVPPTSACQQRQTPSHCPARPARTSLKRTSCLGGHRRARCRRPRPQGRILQRRVRFSTFLPITSLPKYIIYAVYDEAKRGCTAAVA